MDSDIIFEPNQQDHFSSNQDLTKVTIFSFSSNSLSLIFKR